MWARGPNDLPPEERRGTIAALRVILIVALVSTVGVVIAMALGANDGQIFILFVIVLGLFGVFGGRIPAIKELRRRTRESTDAQDPRERIRQLLGIEVLSLVLFALIIATVNEFRWVVVACAVLSVAATSYEIARARRRM